MRGAISAVSNWRRVPRVVVVPAPAAGAEWSIAVPGGHTWDVLSAVATLATSAVAGARQAALVHGDGSAPYAFAAPAATQAASLTRLYSWLRATSLAAVGAMIQQPLVGVRLYAGQTIGTSTDNLDAGDAWTEIRLYVIDTYVQAGDVNLHEAPDMTIEIIDSSTSK